MDRFVCPLCACALTQVGMVLRCPGNHVFDIAREGYVNLLPAHHRRSRQAGDAPDMVAARRAFLDAGHYSPLADALARCVPARARVLDLGCSEGTFTAALGAEGVHGIDISRAAIRRAAKAWPQHVFAVASARRLPFAEGAFDAATAVMAPLFDEARRVLIDGGILVRVTPAPDHLDALRAQVLETVRPHTRASLALPGFRHEDAREVRFEMRLDGAARAALLRMTPLQHRARPDALARAIADPGEQIVEAAFVIDRFCAI